MIPACCINPHSAALRVALSASPHLLKAIFSQQESTSLFCSTYSLILMPRFENGGRGPSVDSQHTNLETQGGKPQGSQLLKAQTRI